MKIGRWICTLDLVAVREPGVTEYQSRRRRRWRRAGHGDAVRGDGARYASAVHLLPERCERAEAALYVHDVVSSGTCPSTRREKPVAADGAEAGRVIDAAAGRLDPRRAKRIENLGVGALLHDVGLLRLSPEAGEKWNRTHDLEDPEIRRHVLLGFGMLRGNVAPTAAAVALHHHQRYDGTGFPRIRRMAGPPDAQGSQIHVFSRIVSVAGGSTG